jgi:hypothetical protein
MAPVWKWLIALLMSFLITTFLLLPLVVRLVPGDVGKSLRDYYLSDESLYGLTLDFSFIVMYVYKAHLLNPLLGGPLWLTLLGVIFVFDSLFGFLLNWVSRYETPFLRRLQAWFAKTGIAPYLWDIPYFMTIFLLGAVLYERL